MGRLHGCWVSLWGSLGDVVDGGMVSMMGCNRSVYLGGAGQGGHKGFSIDDPGYCLGPGKSWKKGWKVKLNDISNWQ